MNIKQLIKKERSEYPKRMPTLKRIKVGRAIAFLAALPLCTGWMWGIAVPLMMPVSISTKIKGKLNQRRGNGDLQLK